MNNEGPTVELTLSCFGCRYVRGESYVVQGDSGINVYCDHPTVGGHQVGDTRWDTPCWCPFRSAAIKAKVAQLQEGGAL